MDANRHGYSATYVFSDVTFKLNRGKAIPFSGSVFILFVCGSTAEIRIMVFLRAWFGKTC